MNITSVHLEAMLMYNKGNFTPLEKKITETNGTVKEEVVMGSFVPRLLPLFGMGEEPGYEASHG